MSAETKTARVMLEVQAGLVPGQPMDEFTKRWAIDSETWRASQGSEADPHFKVEDAREAQDKIEQMYGHAQEHARNLWNPGRVNWVRLDWVYL